MNRRTMGLWFLGSATLVGLGLSACSSDGSGETVRAGTLSLPLATQGPSGTTYRLRDATFEVSSENYYYAGGEGGAANRTVTVSSEENLNADSIRVELERGYYYVRLLPGWRLEKLEGDDATTVEATLLSPETQFLYVREHSTSYVEYNFGLGERELWFNGKANISVNVYENPGDLYGYSGSPDGTAGNPGGLGGDTSR